MAKNSKIYKFATAGTTDAAAAASTVIAKDCFIVAIHWVQYAVGDAAGEGIHCELSLNGATSQHTSHDVSGVIDSCATVVNAIGGGSTSRATTGICFPIREGERLYLNNDAIGTPTTAQTVCYVHVIE